MSAYIFELLECPRVNINTALVILTKIHEFLSIVIFVEDIFAQIPLLLLPLLLHY